RLADVGRPRLVRLEGERAVAGLAVQETAQEPRGTLASWAAAPSDSLGVRVENGAHGAPGRRRQRGGPRRGRESVVAEDGRAAVRQAPYRGVVAEDACNGRRRPCPATARQATTVEVQR